MQRTSYLSIRTIKKCSKTIKNVAISYKYSDVNRQIHADKMFIFN